jgi:predicted secreted protein
LRISRHVNAANGENRMRLNQLALLAGLLLTAQVHAESTMKTSGVEITVPAKGEISHVNEEATATFQAMARSKDKSAGTAEVIRRMKEGLAILRAKDPTAKLQTSAFHFFPQYRKSRMSSADENGRDSEVIGWEINQNVTVVTQDLIGLPKTSAALQGTLDHVYLDFHLTSATAQKLDDQSTIAAYQRLNERIASMALAMGKTMADATLETVTLDVAKEGGDHEIGFSDTRSRSEKSLEPVFEVGETKLTTNILGKVRFK